MEMICTVRGPAASRHPAFTYRKPIRATIDIWQLDPERLHPANEYPRSVNPPSAPTLRIEELADCAVRLGRAGTDGLSLLQVVMQPNEFTAARKELLVCEFSVSNAFTLRHEYVDEALRRVFGAGSEEGQG